MAVAENDQYKAELHAQRHGAAALHAEYVSQQQQIAAYAKQTSDLKAATARQREQYDANAARMMEEIAQLREDIKLETIRRQQDRERWNTKFAAQMALLEESGRRN